MLFLGRPITAIVSADWRVLAIRTFPLSATAISLSSPVQPRRKQRFVASKMSPLTPQNSKQNQPAATFSLGEREAELKPASWRLYCADDPSAGTWPSASTVRRCLPAMPSTLPSTTSATTITLSMRIELSLRDLTPVPVARNGTAIVPKVASAVP